MYTVSFSAFGEVGPNGGSLDSTYLYLFKNGTLLPESAWISWWIAGAVNKNVGFTGSRILVSHLLEQWTCLDETSHVKSTFFQILLRMTSGSYVLEVTLNIELKGFN